MPARLRVNRDALAENYRTCRAAAGGQCGAVVKADACGIGMTEAVGVFGGLGCRHFFVATVGEGLALRDVAPASRIYVFEGALPETAQPMAQAGLIPVINHAQQLATWAPYRHLQMAVHVDTGMNRLGFPPAVAAEQFRGFSVSLLMTHLACADDPDNPSNANQVRQFAAVTRGFPSIPTSIGNSAGNLIGSPYQGDLVRPGIALYGGNPWSKRPNPMQPVLTLEARIVQLRDVRPGEPVGYGGTWRSKGTRRLAVLGLGYADGLPRRLSNCGQAVVRGKRCPIVGRVSMDLTVVDVTDTEAATGDWAELFGPSLPVDEVAKAADTIAYELLTGISPRVARVYEGG